MKNLISLIITFLFVACAGQSSGSGPGTTPLLVEVNVSPLSGNHLVDGSGRTLYSLSSDTANVSNCSGSCLATWPALTVAPNGNVVALGGAYPYKLSTFQRLDNNLTQVTYNGKALYYYVNDASNGQMNGNGVSGFSVVAP